jgi:hypothetical protein
VAAAAGGAAGAAHGVGLHRAVHRLVSVDCSAGWVVCCIAMCTAW